MADKDTFTFQLLTRPGCHLCEKLLNDLVPWHDEYKLSIELIDISNSEQLTAEYAGRIPVLRSENQIICEYFLDEDRLKNYLENHQNIN
ncbi:MAG: glutaredoxin family protein [Pseudomonadota bacterium]